MWKAFVAGVALALCAGPGMAADLTPLEVRWIRGLAPVVTFARDKGFPLDIVVQPQPTPGLTPLGMAFIDGRCKLVLSTRGNARAQRMLDRIDTELLGPALELMAAHELGHCQRHLIGVFPRAAAGFSDGVEAPAGRHTEALRREEAYADIVGLAWTQRRYPALYARLHRWLLETRLTDNLPGSEHDTTAWLQRVRDGSVLVDADMFGVATAVLMRESPADD